MTSATSTIDATTMMANDGSASNDPCGASNNPPPPPYESAQSGELSEPLLRRRNVSAINDHRRDGDITEDHSQAPPRILDRDGAFHQSRGRWSVQRLSRGIRLQAPGSRYRVLWEDWFHKLAYQRTLVLMFILFLIYTAIVFFFAFVYLGVSKVGAPATNGDGSIKHSFCGMDINNHMEALYFSLSTMTTIGYGVSDYYFGDCWTPLLLVLWQSCAAITFNAVAIGLLFQRISRGQKRSKTILFSDKAVVRRVRGVPYLMFRVGELRRHFLIEACVRAYCLRHERLPVTCTTTTTTAQQQEPCEIETTYFHTRPVWLLNPNESLGPYILMGLPQVIVHRLDERSPLRPPRPVWYDAGGYRHGVEGRTDDDDEREAVKAFLSDREAELIVHLEGTDELTGSAIQARHSYRVDDIVWDHSFVSCVSPTSIFHENDEAQSWRDWFRRRYCEPCCKVSVGAPACTIDFSKFHDIVRAPPDCDACAYVPQ